MSTTEKYALSDLVFSHNGSGTIAPTITLQPSTTFIPEMDAGNGQTVKSLTPSITPTGSATNCTITVPEWSLKAITLTNAGLTAVDVSAFLPNVEQIDFSNNSLSAFDASGLFAVTDLDLSDNDLSQSAVDQLLSDMDSLIPASGTIGTLDVSNQSTGAVVDTGSTSATAAQSIADKGWAVTATGTWSNTNETPTTSTISNQVMVIGEAFSFNVAGFFSDADGDTLTYSTASTLPAGLTLSSSGVISGTPTAVGSSLVIVTASDSTPNLVDSNQFVLSVCLVPLTAPSVRTIPDHTRVTSTSVSLDMSRYFRAPEGETITYSTTSTLPAGMSLSATGILSGTPTGVETQGVVIRATASGGGITDSGSFDLEIAATEPAENLWQISQMDYAGGFKVGNITNNGATTDFSRGIFALSETRDSIFLTAQGDQIGEFQIPAVVNTKDFASMNFAPTLQNFGEFNDPTGKYDPGVNSSRMRQTGMYATDGKLVVNYYDYYDAGSDDVNTTAVMQDSSDIVNTNIVGPFQLDGSAQSAGWITDIPTEHQTTLGGTHISGWSQGSINSRLSNGPSGWVWDVDDIINDSAGEAITATAVMNYPLEGILHDQSNYNYTGTFPENEVILQNLDGNNQMWTYLSTATFGFIIPGTDTYMTVGRSGGHNAGIGYKIVLPTGEESSGHDALDGKDYETGFYWLWKVSDLVAAKNGTIQPEDLQPYDYGPFDTLDYEPSLLGVSSGAFDAITNKLYLSIGEGDQQGNFSRPPVFLVYDINL